MSKWRISLIILFFLILTFFAGCIESSQSNSLTLDQIAGVGLVVHDHWTEKDTNDGKIVYIDLINKRNVALGKSDNADIRNLKVKLRVLGYDTTTKDYTIELFSKTYSNLNYYGIYYPQGDGIVIYYNEIKKYENQCCTGITAEVTLPDGRVLKTHEIHDFNINPTVVK